MSEPALEFTIAPMQPDERNLVLSCWMRGGTHWHRSDILSCVERGHVLVATSDGLAIGWLATLGDEICHAWVRRGYRELGVARTLWEQAGRPGELHQLAHAAALRARRARRNPLTWKLMQRVHAAKGRAA